jgi:NitT/TauT family transport system substrate-binding protein
LAAASVSTFTSLGIGDVGEPSQLFKQMTNRRTDLLKEYSKSAGKFSANWTFVFAGLSTVVLLLSVFSQKSFSAEMTFAYPALSSSQAIYWVTYEQGLFKKNNLDVQLIYIGYGPAITQAMLSGDLKITGGAAVSSVRSNLSGADTVMVANFFPTIPYTLVARREIRKPEDLIGKSVGINAFGGTLDMVARYFLEKLSLKPIDQVPLRVIAGQAPQRIAALKNGIIDALVLDIPSVPIAERFGAHVLIDMLKIDKPLPYPFATTITTRSYIRNNPANVRSVVRALIEGVHRYKTMKTETIRILGKYLRSDDMSFLADTYAFSSKLLQEKPYVSPDAVASVLRQISISDTDARTKLKLADPQTFVDNRFIKEAEEDGFVASLYKSR